MSWIYEALRQKNQEIPTSNQSNGWATQVGAEEVGSVRQPHPDPLEQLLRAAITATDEELPHEQGGLYDPEPVPELDFREAAPPRLERNPSAQDFPRLSLRHPGKSRLVFQSDPGSLAAEQLRFLRRTLEQEFPTGAVLLLTSPAPKDGKTLTAFNLGACLADSCHSTLLLEGDTRRPSFHKLLGGRSTVPGIEEALAGTIDPKEVVHFVQELSLYVAQVTEPPRDPSRLISGIGAKQFLTWAKEHFHWVVLDSPPVLQAVDVTQLATLANTTLLVVRAGSTPRELTTRAIELLGNHLFGVILNEATIKSTPYYRYLIDYRQSEIAHRDSGLDNDKQS